jgi:hypothetical protein
MAMPVYFQIIFYLIAVLATVLALYVLIDMRLETRQLERIIREDKDEPGRGGD